MKTSAIFGIVVAAHCVAVGAVLMIQGCETVRGPESTMEDTVVMPPPSVVKQQPARRITDAPVRTTRVTPAFPVDTTTYVVAKGDTLSMIAYKYELKVDDLILLNGLQNKNMIRIGQKIILPGKISVDAPRKTQTTEVVIAPGDGLYVVKSGDCLSAIASSSGVKTQDLRDANDIVGDKIKVGQKLVIPGGKVSAGSSVVRGTVPDAPAPRPSPVVDLPAPVVSGAAVTAPAPRAPMDPSKYRPYTVPEGEDLYSVGLAWVISVEELKKINGLTGTTLEPGQIIYIPITD